MNSTVFLQRYRIMEGLLEKRYTGKRLSYSSVVIEYLHEADSLPVRTDLDLLREIRNILSHHAGTLGEAVIEPSDEMLTKLDKVTEYIRTPRRADAFGTPAAQIQFAQPETPIRNVIDTMRDKGYSHIPVIGKNGFAGVFSIRTVFDYVAENGTESLTNESVIADLGDVIKIDRHISECYRFVAADTSIVDVQRGFSAHEEKNRRLVMVFVTEHGQENEPLICVLTPWDVLGEGAYLRGI